LLEGVEKPDLIAVTAGPGLLPALLTGVSVALGLSRGWGVPIMGINHVVAHIAASALEQDIRLPVLGLVVSGGHTSFYLIEQWNNPQLLGWTYDDAAGECLDKVGRALGMRYPAGPEMDRLALTIQERIDLPLPLKNEDSFNFSFSGLKTAALQQKGKVPSDVLAASLMDAVVKHLLDRVDRVLKKYPFPLVVGGGVSASNYLRDQFIAHLGSNVVFPSPKRSTDNAEMIAAYAELLLNEGVEPGACVSPDPNMDMGWC
jgi:N6-L-threonylcarbamoyladenine synthase